MKIFDRGKKHELQVMAEASEELNRMHVHINLKTNFVIFGDFQNIDPILELFSPDICCVNLLIWFWKADFHHRMKFKINIYIYVGGV